MRFPFLFLACAFALPAADQVLIVADEFPAMEILAAKLKAGEGVPATIVKQTEIPSDLSGYSAVVVYIHRAITEPAEKSFIQYAEAGGKLVLLHHSLGSGKRQNRYWFPFVQISLPEQPFEQGGYRWTEGVTIELVNLAPHEYITTHQVKYDRDMDYTSSESGAAGRYPGFRLEGSEVYLNQILTGSRTMLLGLKYTDHETGKTYMQDRGGWYMKRGSGWVVYLMPGHTAADFQNEAYGQIAVNAIAARMH
jgi:hypothetical protein